MQRILAMAMACFLGAAAVGHARDETAIETLKERHRAIERAQAALDSTSDDGTKEEALDRAVRDAFDFGKLARESIGEHWNRMSQQQRDEYLRLFRSLVLRSTVRKLEEYRAARTEYPEVQTDSNRAVITTIVTSRSEEQIAIQYKLHRVSGRWWVWDTTIGLDTEITEYDVSTAENYRSAFNKLVSEEGIGGLLAKLREKEGGGGELEEDTR